MYASFSSIEKTKWQKKTAHRAVILTLNFNGLPVFGESDLRYRQPRSFQYHAG